MREDYDERDLEDELTKHITQLLLELGKGFSFCGRQVELVVSGTSYRIDILFYHIRLKCYVVVELKTHAFQPEYAGKLNFYVTAVDKLLKQEEDNPTIGLLICKTKDETKVEWAFNGINKPLGVAAYEINNIIPKEIVSKLPTIEEVEQGLNKVEVPKKSSKEYNNSPKWQKCYLGEYFILSNASSILLALVGYVYVPSVTLLVVAGLAHNLRLSALTAESLWDCDERQTYCQDEQSLRQ